MTITLFGASRELPFAPWVLLMSAGVLATFLFAFLWKILSAEEGFLFGYGNWTFGRWKGRERQLESPSPLMRRDRGDLQVDLQVKADVLTLCRLLDGDLAYLMMQDAGGWESKIMRALQTIVSGAVRVAAPEGRSRSGFFILDDEEEHLVLAAGEGYERSRRPRLAMDHSCAGRAFLTGEDYYCRDILTDPAYWRSARDNRDYRSIACVPVRAGRAVFGVLCLDAREPDAFSADDFAHLEVLAAKLALFCALHTLQATGVCSFGTDQGT